jgi:Competence-damaged protein
MGGDVGRRGADRAHRRGLRRLCVQGFSRTTRWSLRAPAQTERRPDGAATWGIGLTGVAGPEPHGGHPVGTVFLGIAGPVDTEVIELTLSGSRWDIRIAAVHEAAARPRALVEQQ